MAQSHVTAAELITRRPHGDRKPLAGMRAPPKTRHADGAFIGGDQIDSTIYATTAATSSSSWLQTPGAAVTLSTTPPILGASMETGRIVTWDEETYDAMRTHLRQGLARLESGRPANQALASESKPIFLDIVKGGKQKNSGSSPSLEGIRRVLCPDDPYSLVQKRGTPRCKKLLAYAQSTWARPNQKCVNRSTETCGCWRIVETYHEHALIPRAPDADYAPIIWPRGTCSFFSAVRSPVTRPDALSQTATARRRGSTELDKLALTSQRPPAELQFRSLDQEQPWPGNLKCSKSAA